jgi:hypothetical protein
MPIQETFGHFDFKTVSPQQFELRLVIPVVLPPPRAHVLAPWT